MGRERGRTGLQKRVSGRHVVRGRQSSPIPAPASRVSGLAVRGRARVTGKAGENGQNSGEVGGSSAWTRPSAPEYGDTLKALAGDQRPLQGRLGHRPVVLLRMGLNVQSGQRKGGKCAAAPLPERCRPWSWTLKRCCGERIGP